MTRVSSSVLGKALSLWPWLLAAAIVVAALVALALIIDRRRGRRTAMIVTGVALAWILGLGFAFAQFVPGVAGRLPTPFALEGQGVDREVTLHEARDSVSFHVFVPTHLPRGFRLESIKLAGAGRPSDGILTISYYDRRSGAELQVRQTHTSGPAVTPGQANLKIMGQDAEVTTTQELTAIEWSYGTTRIEMSGRYGKAAMIRIANSMR